MSWNGWRGGLLSFFGDLYWALEFFWSFSLSILISRKLLTLRLIEGIFYNSVKNMRLSQLFLAIFATIFLLLVFMKNLGLTLCFIWLVPIFASHGVELRLIPFEMAVWLVGAAEFCKISTVNFVFFFRIDWFSLSVSWGIVMTFFECLKFMDKLLFITKFNLVWQIVRFMYFGSACML